MATYVSKPREVEAHKWDGKLSNLPEWIKKLIASESPEGELYIKCDYHGLERFLYWPIGRYLVQYPYGTEIVRAEDFEKVYELKGEV